MSQSTSTPRAVGAPSTLDWARVPREPRAAAGTIDVLRADLDGVADDMLELLSPQERARAERFAAERDRVLWTRARGLLRRLLGSYLGQEPGALRFGAGPHGKPALLGERTPPRAGHELPAGGSPPVCFNVSHSGHLALYAFSPIGEVGVDVELPRRPRNELAIAARALGPQAARRLAQVDPAHRPHEFLRAWVRHEAAAKCTGVGIGAGSGPGATATERRDCDRDRGLWLAELDVGPPAAAAVAAENRPRELRLWEWHG